MAARFNYSAYSPIDCAKDHNGEDLERVASNFANWMLNPEKDLDNPRLFRLFIYNLI